MNSETIQKGQAADIDIDLQLGALAKRLAPEQPVETITYERSTGPTPQRTLPAQSFAHLPVREAIELIPEAVPQDPSLYVRIGEEQGFHGEEEVKVG